MQGRGEKGGKGKEVWGKEEKHHEKYHSSKEGRQLKKSRITKEAHEAWPWNETDEVSFLGWVLAGKGGLDHCPRKLPPAI